VLLELEISELFLAAQWVVFPFELVQLQLMLQPIELLLLLELVQLPLRLVELLLTERCCKIGATGCLWFVSYHGGFPPDNMARIPPKSL
jgi:hypothetical protein